MSSTLTSHTPDQAVRLVSFKSIIDFLKHELALLGRQTPEIHRQTEPPPLTRFYSSGLSLTGGEMCGV